VEMALIYGFRRIRENSDWCDCRENFTSSTIVMRLFALVKHYVKLFIVDG